MDSGREEKKDAIEVFPLEVWTKIFGNLTRSDDLTNCYTVTVDWMKLLHQRSSTFLPGRMAKVFLLVDNYYDFSAQDILNFRLVSHSFKESIDFFLQQHPYHSGIGFSKARDPPRNLFHIPSLGPSIGEKFRRLVEDTNVNTCPDMNPFFSRSIDYNEQLYPRIIHAVGYNSPIFAQRQLFREVMTRFGDQIWYVRLSINEYDHKIIYQLVNSFLTLMPNLRSLAILVDSETVKNPHHMTSEREELLRTQPLPRLEHLVCLGIGGRVTNPLECGLLLQYNHVKKLSRITHTVDGHPTFPPNVIQSLELSRLQQLMTCLHCEPDIVALQSKSGSWTLTHMNLASIELKDLNPVFRGISSFSNTLKHLKLSFELEDIDDDLKNVTERLNLLKLESIKIKAKPNRYLNKIDFILGCVVLKELELDLWTWCNGLSTHDPQRGIQIIGAFDSMYTSNIWRVLKNLNKIRMSTKIHYQMGQNPNIEYIFLHPSKIHATWKQVVK